MRIVIGSDHAGYPLKEHIKEYLKGIKAETVDVGAASEETSDYPDFGVEVARIVSSGETEKGILVCGSGIGMTIIANKFPGIRAALCMDVYTAKMCSKHNNANILVLAGRKTDFNEAEKIVKTWLDTEFDGGRHARRLNKISEIETRLLKNQMI